MRVRVRVRERERERERETKIEEFYVTEQLLRERRFLSSQQAAAE